MNVEYTQSYLYEPILKRRSKMTKKQRQKASDVNQSIKWLNPSGVERKYKNELNKYFQAQYDAIFDFIEPNYDEWLNELKSDGIGQDLGNLRTYIATRMKKLFGVSPKEAIVKKLGDIATGIDAFNTTQWQKFVGSVIGQSSKVASFIIPPEPWKKASVELWTTMNHQLWTNASEQLINEVTRIVGENVAQGKLWTQTKKDLVKILPKKKGSPDFNRAKLISRDQTAKLNATFAQKRMKEAKLTVYKWLTARDERVRGLPSGKFPKAVPRHDIMEGTLGDYDRPLYWSKDGGTTWTLKIMEAEKLPPGWAIQCRCTPQPSFVDMFNTIDASFI